jgi:hypothetical protein
VMALIMLFSRFPSAQSAVEIRFDNLFLVDILPVVECGGLGCNSPVVGNPLGNVNCLPGTQAPRGFYLIEFKLNYSPALESGNRTQDRQLALPVGSLACPQCLQKLVCAVRGFASWQSQHRRLGSPYAPPHLPRHSLARYKRLNTSNHTASSCGPRLRQPVRPGLRDRLRRPPRLPRRRRI